jgi:GT2 family glycosyltransferase
MSRDRFLGVGGLDEARFPIGYNDVDLMMRSAASGLTHLYLGHVWAEHARGSTRSGDSEDLQALILNREHPDAAVRRLLQLERRRVAAPRAVTAQAASRPEQELVEALQAAVQARQSLEAERAKLLRKKGPSAILPAD